VPLRPGRFGIFPKESLHVVSTHILVASFCLSSASAFAVTRGDIAFTSFNADEDGWSIVALTELTSHSTLYFTDSNWDGNAFATNEGFYAWDTGATPFWPARSSASARSTRATVRYRSALNMLRNAALSGTSETLYAYLGEAADRPTIFLAAVTTEAPASAAAALTSAGLTAGVNAVSLPESTDYSTYNGARSGRSAFSSYGTLINDPANWSGFTDGSHADAQPVLAAFSVSAVPEASMGWMMLAGLALVAARRRR
jgi:MYXO-CTERM domain-containing protein